LITIYRGLVGHAKGTYKRGVVWDTFVKQEEARSV